MKVRHDHVQHLEQVFAVTNEDSSGEWDGGLHTAEGETKHYQGQMT